MLLDELLTTLLERRGSDLRLTEGAPPLLRIDGHLHPVDGAADLDEEQATRLVLAAIPENLLAEFRANAFMQKGVPALRRARAPRGRGRAQPFPRRDPAVGPSPHRPARRRPSGRRATRRRG